MNYFELYNLPVSFAIDKTLLQKKYFELQKKYHPDYNVNESPQQQQAALEASSMANKAYNTFRNEDATMQYLLQLLGLLQPEEKYQLPQAFLMEMMELNELKMDDENASQLQQQLATLQANMHQAIAPLLQQYQHGTTPIAALLPLKEYYFKKKYVDRIMAHPGQQP